MNNRCRRLTQGIKCKGKRKGSRKQKFELSQGFIQREAERTFEISLGFVQVVLRKANLFGESLRGVAKKLSTLK